MKKVLLIGAALVFLMGFTAGMAMAKTFDGGCNGGCNGGCGCGFCCPPVGYANWAYQYQRGYLNKAKIVQHNNNWAEQWQFGCGNKAKIRVCAKLS